MDEKDYFFGEWVHIFSDEDLEDGYAYLRLWKMFFLRKHPAFTLINDNIVEKDKTDLTPRTLGIKLHLKAQELQEKNDEN